MRSTNDATSSGCPTNAARTTSAITAWSASRSGRMTTPSATGGDGNRGTLFAHTRHVAAVRGSSLSLAPSGSPDGLLPERVDGDGHLLVDLRADEGRRRLGRTHHFAQDLDIVGEEARGLAEPAGVVDAPGAVEIADRDGDVQAAARAGQRDVEEP